MTCECPEEIHKGAIGLEFVATIKEKDDKGNCVVVDVSTATDLYILLDDPDGLGVQKTATLYTDGKDGKIVWATTLVGDLSVLGDWRIQGRVQIAGGDFYSNIDTFRVYDNIEVP